MCSGDESSSTLSIESIDWSSVGLCGDNISMRRFEEKVVSAIEEDKLDGDDISSSNAMTWW
ncbi:21701_t:CDS:2 [Entrophospora sp. SA101]|nr:21701_t:CDS:2 [Entrophospora sp. SA101]